MGFGICWPEGIRGQLVWFLQPNGCVRPESGRVFGLDLMRAGAIALVLLSHTALWYGFQPLVFQLGLLAGYFGVELFFVLSGFLIGGILIRSLAEPTSHPSLLAFWRRRWWRTLPNYFLFLVVNLGLHAWLYGKAPLSARYLVFCQNLTGPPPPFFTESWSLAVEEWFYLLVPILFFASFKMFRRRFASASLWLICMVIVAVTAARFAYVYAAHPVWLKGVRIVVAYRLDACMFGVLAAWVKHFRPNVWASGCGWNALLGLTVLVFNASLPYSLAADSYMLHTIGFSITSLGAALLLPYLDGWRTAGGWGKPVVRLSLWSYSLYLVNMPIFAVLFERCFHRRPFFGTTAFICLSLLFAAGIYRFYEKPIIAFRDNGGVWRRLLSFFEPTTTRAPETLPA